MGNGASIASIKRQREKEADRKAGIQKGAEQAENSIQDRMDGTENGGMGNLEVTPFSRLKDERDRLQEKNQKLADDVGEEPMLCAGTEDLDALIEQIKGLKIKNDCLRETQESNSLPKKKCNRRKNQDKEAAIRRKRGEEGEEAKADVKKGADKAEANTSSHMDGTENGGMKHLEGTTRETQQSNSNESNRSKDGTTFSRPKDEFSYLVTLSEDSDALFEQIKDLKRENDRLRETQQPNSNKPNQEKKADGSDQEQGHGSSWLKLDLTQNSMISPICLKLDLTQNSMISPVCLADDIST